MKLLRKKARGEQPVQLSLLENNTGYYLPCKYCKSDKCKIAPLKQGMWDPAFAYPWTRAHPPASSARIVLTPCEALALKDSYVQLHIRVREETPKLEKKQDVELPVLSARETAERILQVCSAKRGRTKERLCELAGIAVSEVVDRVLDFLLSNDKVAIVLDNRWILA